MTIRVFIAVDHDIMRAGLRSLLEKEPDIRVIGEASNGRQAVEMAKELAPNIVIMDVGMSDLNGIDATRQIVKNSGDDDAMVVSELLEQKGAAGYDAAKSKFVDMFEAGIIDPAKVTRCALQNAASVAGLMLTTNVLISDLKDDEEPVAGAVS